VHRKQQVLNPEFYPTSFDEARTITSLGLLNESQITNTIVGRRERKRGREPFLKRAGSLWGLLPRAPTDPGVPIKAPGSSRQGIHFPALLSVGVTLSATRVRSPRRLSHIRFLNGHPPSLPRVPAVQVPLLLRYYGDVRLPASLSLCFVSFARHTMRCACRFAPVARRQTAGQGCIIRSPLRK